MHDIWNPWHGCVKYSEGCKNCYMYALDHQRGVAEPSDQFRLTKQLHYPVKKDRKGNYKIKSGERIRVNMTSDTFLEDADEYRHIVWECIRERPDVIFWILTKRVPRIAKNLPDDWGAGYPNVMLNMTVENQRAFNERWLIFSQIPARAKGICCAPLLSHIDLTPALSTGQICEVSAGGENYDNPRPCHYEWYESLSRQCEKYHVNFHWYETGTKLIKDKQLYYIPRKPDQTRVAGMSGLNRFYGRPNLILTDPENGHILAPCELHVPMYNPAHCLHCGNRDICNGCSPTCPQYDKSSRLVTRGEIEKLDQADILLRKTRKEA